MVNEHVAQVQPRGGVRGPELHRLAREGLGLLHSEFRLMETVRLWAGNKIRFPKSCRPVGRWCTLSFVALDHRRHVRSCDGISPRYWNPRPTSYLYVLHAGNSYSSLHVHFGRPKNTRVSACRSRTKVSSFLELQFQWTDWLDCTGMQLVLYTCACFALFTECRERYTQIFVDLRSKYIQQIKFHCCP